MSTGFRLTDTADPEETLGDLLTYAEPLTTPQLARLYVYVLRNGPIAISPAPRPSLRCIAMSVSERRWVTDPTISGSS